MFERFTDSARRVLVRAEEAARLLNHDFIGTEHLLLGLIDDDDRISAQSLRSLGVSPEAVRGRVDEMIGAPRSSNVAPPAFTPRAKQVLSLALRESLGFGHADVVPEHFLLGILVLGDGLAVQVLVELGA